MLRSGRWWLAEGFSDFLLLSPLCKVEGPSEKMGRVEYGLEGSRIFLQHCEHTGLLQNWQV